MSDSPKIIQNKERLVKSVLCNSNQLIRHTLVEVQGLDESFYLVDFNYFINVHSAGPRSYIAHICNPSKFFSYAYNLQKLIAIGQGGVLRDLTQVSTLATHATQDYLYLTQLNSIQKTIEQKKDVKCFCLKSIPKTYIFALQLKTLSNSNIQET